MTYFMSIGADIVGNDQLEDVAMGLNVPITSGFYLAPIFSVFCNFPEEEW